MKGNTWEQWEIEIVRRYYSSSTNCEMLDRLQGRRSSGAIAGMASKLKVKRVREFNRNFREKGVCPQCGEYAETVSSRYDALHGLCDTCYHREQSRIKHIATYKHRKQRPQKKDGSTACDLLFDRSLECDDDVLSFDEIRARGINRNPTGRVNPELSRAFFDLCQIERDALLHIERVREHLANQKRRANGY